MTATHRIKAKALQLGFSKVGVARAEELAQEGAHLREWLDRGYGASMDWMGREREKRIDPRNVLSNAKSVISVAMNYYTPEPHSANPEVGKISRYAWGDDYHIVLTERLELLKEFIAVEIPGAHAKLYVDTGPAMDKAWAQRAGIGWIGKHTNVISKEFGSWIFLGEIIVDATLEYDEPFLDFCGFCRACIDACPTDAIVEEYVLDSNKCISYLTIEHRGELPKELTPDFENWVYGCDICQDVCPWNRFQQETREKAFQPREFNKAPALSDLSLMRQEEFTERFRKSPIKRTKRSGLSRNANAILDSVSGVSKNKIAAESAENAE
jgi:epoxyqueuosine reductase